MRLSAQMAWEISHSFLTCVETENISVRLTTTAERAPLGFLRSLHDALNYYVRVRGFSGSTPCLVLDVAGTESITICGCYLTSLRNFRDTLLETAYRRRVSLPPVEQQARIQMRQLRRMAQHLDETYPADYPKPCGLKNALG